MPFIGIVEESHAGSDVYSSGIQYEKPVSCIVAGRGVATFVGVCNGHPIGTVSDFDDISRTFILTGGTDLGGKSLRNLLFGLKVKEGCCICWRLALAVRITYGRGQ
jgi:hypothetical protein